MLKLYKTHLLSARVGNNLLVDHNSDLILLSGNHSTSLVGDSLIE